MLKKYLYHNKHFGAYEKKNKPRIVPPFSIQSTQKDVIVAPLPRNTPERLYPVGKTVFRKYYERGDFPIAMEFDTYGYKIAWKVRRIVYFNTLNFLLIG